MTAGDIIIPDMINPLKTHIVRLGLLPMLLVTSLAFIGTGCPSLASFDSHGHITIENQTGQNLTITYEYGMGTVVPGEALVIPMDFHHFSPGGIIAAKNDEGELVFLKEFSFDDFIKTDEREYKAVIPSGISLHGPSTVKIIVMNLSELDLSLHVNDTLIEEINGGASFTTSVPVEWGVHNVVLKDLWGDRTFSRKYTFESIAELEESGITAVVTVPYQDIYFQNTTDKTLTVFLNFCEIGTVRPGETMVKSVPWYYRSWVIFRAEDTESITIYNEIFKYSSPSGTVPELENAGWKIVLRPFIE
ncbi:hypothetical protein ACFLW1_02545 [Chloroflexota bacterium]